MRLPPMAMDIVRARILPNKLVLGAGSWSPRSTLPDLYRKIYADPIGRCLSYRIAPPYLDDVQSRRAMDSNRRRAERYPIHLPVEYDEGAGTTHDISLGGIFFETSRELEIGSPIRFSFSLEHGPAGEPLQISCHGRIVRVQHGDATRVGVAATIEQMDIGALNMTVQA